MTEHTFGKVRFEAKGIPGQMYIGLANYSQFPAPINSSHFFMLLTKLDSTQFRRASQNSFFVRILLKNHQNAL